MPPSEPQPGRAAGPPPHHPAGTAVPAAGRSDPLRGLADAPAAHAAAPGANPPSLWSRIKRAFQYGSQGGERG